MPRITRKSLPFASRLVVYSQCWLGTPLPAGRQKSQPFLCFTGSFQEANMKYILRQVSSFVVPIILTTLLPVLIAQWEHHSKNPLVSSSIFHILTGSVITLAGLLLFIATVITFIRIGNGTIMPWDPTRKLVVAGVYRYVRNPMILGVLIILVGEALLFASYWIAALSLLFFGINTVYFIFSEEPGLVKRFGQEYREYMQNVPRWLPRRRPWRPSESEISRLRNQ
jgi:protein-S-isoprenylcysteine O-methyltransferase Ste14